MLQKSWLTFPLHPSLCDVNYVKINPFNVSLTLSKFFELTLIATLQQEEVRIAGAGGLAGADNEGHEEVQPEPLDMAFPKNGLRKQITYIILFPIIFPLWLTLPDTRSQKGETIFTFNCRNLIHVFYIFFPPHLLLCDTLPLYKTCILLATV